MCSRWRDVTYPNSPQIEIPSQTSTNPWVDTLLWIRHNTPTNAVFAVDSHYFKDSESDVHGFRAISARSALADYYKDSGVVSLFPGLADEWKQMSSATYGLNHFNIAQFQPASAAISRGHLDSHSRLCSSSNGLSVSATLHSGYSVSATCRLRSVQRLGTDRPPQLTTAPSTTSPKCHEINS